MVYPGCVDLRYWMRHCEVSGKELARRLGHSSSGFITLVANGKRGIPPDEVIKWADALRLSADDRERFIASAMESGVPEWVRETIQQLRAQVKAATDLAVRLKAENAELLRRLGDR